MLVKNIINGVQVVTDSGVEIVEADAGLTTVASLKGVKGYLIATEWETGSSDMLRKVSEQLATGELIETNEGLFRILDWTEVYRRNGFEVSPGVRVYPSTIEEVKGFITELDDTVNYLKSRPFLNKESARQLTKRISFISLHTLFEAENDEEWGRKIIALQFVSMKFEFQSCKAQSALNYATEIKNSLIKYLEYIKRQQ